MSQEVIFNPLNQIATELKLKQAQVAATVGMLEQGDTVPFIARYRKERSGNLDELQIRLIEERHNYLLELEQRKQAILKSIDEQGKLSDELKQKILACDTKAVLEDIYLPYKPKRRTRAAIAREKGLEPLAMLIVEQDHEKTPQDAALHFIDAEKKVTTAEEALKGARDIVAELIAERADVRAYVRDLFSTQAVLHAEAEPEKTDKPTKFETYYDYREAISQMPSHRFLAIRRGEREGVLRTNLEIESETVLDFIASKMDRNPQSAFCEQLDEAVQDSYRRLLFPSIETEIRTDLKMRADRAAVEVFAQNLRNLLLAAPMGSKNVIAIDPGIRTGCKCVALDAYGSFMENWTIYPFSGKQQKQTAYNDLKVKIAAYKPYAIAIGNGTAGRECEHFVRDLIKQEKQQSERAAAQLWENILVVSVNESGASVYSASDVAREEFPELDVTVRGAISIGRRLQDPLAELVKIDPKSIGVGQYQHDVYQPLLKRKLEDVVESCVNHVGVELNTASASLLSYVAGIGNSVAKKILAYRQENGGFQTRAELKTVSGLGDKTFQQAAGFLRIHGGANPLDASAVHPERYELVARIAADLNSAVAELIGNPDVVKKIDIRAYVSEDVGEATLQDIFAELHKPGRDPREDFQAPNFRDDVTSLEDLEIGMYLEGVVTNVTKFGAFVDIGVHQDGLVHISQLADHFVKEPSDVVSVGDKIKVQVLELDPQRKRISLTAKQQQSGQQLPKQQNQTPAKQKAKEAKSSQQNSMKNSTSSGKFVNNPFADMLKRM